MFPLVNYFVTLLLNLIYLFLLPTPIWTQKKSFYQQCSSIMIENITGAFKEKNIPWAFFLDIPKAFDTIDQSILLFKLNHHGIKELYNNWSNNKYLSNHSMQREANGKVSSPLLINLGVP